ncbi:MAG: hypothetical protein JJT89_01085 [Nitriliruptoraceae bacterium]|nr:hypothetical protein [Nitriliruptoraceae bacterium]
MAGRKQAFVDRVNRVIGPRTGYWLRSVAPGLPTTVVDDPRWADLYEAASGAGVGYRASMADGRLHAYPLGPGGTHPWAVAVDRSGAGRDAARLRVVLEAYYRLVRPADATDWFGVDPELFPGGVGVPAVAAVLPWSLQSPDEALARATARQERERRGYGLGPDVALGSPSFGPMADVQLDAEARKLARIASILDREPIDPGRVDYDLGATVLVGDGTVRWFGNAGRHRIAVLQAQGASHVELAIRAVVRRAEAERWPQVVAGRITVAGALQIFDRLFDGWPPPVAEPWLAWLREDDRSSGTGAPDDRSS